MTNYTPEDLFEKTKELSLLTYGIEEKREQNLFDQSGKMLTSISIITVALLSFISLEKLGFDSNQTIAIIGMTFTPLIFSFIFAIITQWRYAY
ncbi:hypothetical protein MmiEs2_05790 [Methanimicrococcus stummii]|uniref:Uncharacterized protein n=1 Tax=Methanimicrococcus stummii TaxID=3028294 RepID=A0AA96V880_9EURY|nr:hypothetical protein [Methanimicrococcus sp. Es2]WNY28394.1 hypothetical protein MmiEs2_05790 [Methanimicrococcus sp. Es2]